MTIKQKVAIGILLLISYSCINQGDNNTQKESFNNDTNNYEAEQLSHNQIQYPEQNVIKALQDHKNFPYDYVVTQSDPNCEESRYYFYSDNTLVIKYLYSGDDYEIGYWEITQDTIVMTIKKSFGREGVGEPIIPEHMGGMNNCNDWEYHSYTNYEKVVDDTIKLALADIDGEYWYQFDPSENASDFNYKELNFSIEGDYKLASLRILDSTEIKNYTKEELRLMRNEIFARYYYIFKSEDLRLHFESKKWYLAKRKNVNGFLSDIEKRNIELIRKFEK